MKKFMAVGVIAVALLASALPAFATPPVGNFGGDHGVWVNDNAPGHHYVNTNNPDVRMDWDNQRFAVPGPGGAHADENSAVISWTGGGTLVDPHDTLPQP
jgi:hypothetical protein